MGQMTDSLRQIERAFTSKNAEKEFYKKKKHELEIFLYNKFYNKFYLYKNNNPDNIYGLFLNPDKKQEILNNYNELDEMTKNEIYNKTLKKIYTDFKKYYDFEISMKKEDKIEQKEKTKLLKELEKAKKRYYMANAKKQKAIEKFEEAKQKNAEIKNKYITGGIAAILIGGALSNKTIKNKNKYKL